MILRHISEIPARHRRRGFVPTMGALHEGHLELIRAARRESDEVGVSIFVNPTQFGPNEDFARYPRMLEADCEKAFAAGATWIFAPDVQEVYPRKTTVVSVQGITDLHEGAVRPGHFDGVATVVLKLFHIADCTDAFFGQKDLQQCLVIRRMVEDLNHPVRLHFVSTVREPDGLAMSSRNAYLSPEARNQAPIIYRELSSIRDELRRDPSADFTSLRERAYEVFRAHGLVPDYLRWVSLDTLLDVESREIPSALIVAARLEAVRLIDNVIVSGDL